MSAVKLLPGMDPTAHLASQWADRSADFIEPDLAAERAQWAAEVERLHWCAKRQAGGCTCSGETTPANGCTCSCHDAFLDARAEAERLREALVSLTTRADRAAVAEAWSWKDHACAECAPDEESVRVGFRCSRHEAHALIAGASR